MSSLLPANSKVAVLGAGISGLSFTYFLSKLRPDLQFHVFEKSSRPAGWINSSYLHVDSSGQDIVLEKGPRTLRGIKDGTLIILDILRELGLSDEIQVVHANSPANKKYIMNQAGEVVQVPNSISTLFKFLTKVNVVDPSLVWGILKEPFVKPNLEDETVEQFIKRRFGSDVLTDNVVSAIFHGIYAGDVGKLSVSTVLPQLKDMERESGSIIRHILKLMRAKKKETGLSSNLQTYESLISPNANFVGLKTQAKNCPMVSLQHGLEVLPHQLTEYLAKRDNITFHYNTPITELDPVKGTVNGEKFNHIRSTINVNSVAKALPSTNSLVPHLKSVNYGTVFLCNIYTKGSNKLIPADKSGFGFLVPRFRNVHSNPQALLGVIFDSEVEKNAVGLFNKIDKKELDYDKITIMMGGHYYSQWGMPSQSINIKIVKQVLEAQLKVDLSKFNIRVVDGDTVEDVKDNDLIISCNYHRDAIPQYEVGYVETHREVDQIVKDGQYLLSFGGTVFGDGLGVPDCVINAFKDALKLR
ncbi:uncharacterized protein SPAPADRAFT_55778 [Spathaspora passalidarum NRRL Y-27907]|uniref:Protoporphyrinogen oxidase n=1 Tax=Spathaspora passalidarum (strain NRRL Y-27907 / 11-Y1) TaxID=619300 RepID=G3APW7_SPAPN|nr:uncharacterized protein SPAPADRAFT_55778 [Spathaspora passalidarum NRRL Y-27907]EGW32288.1 hypothetical protein SPAPADRAFT_55778 [Spathaspora passalidarum NRRL Y-27907]